MRHGTEADEYRALRECPFGISWATWALSGSCKDEKADDGLKELCCC